MNTYGTVVSEPRVVVIVVKINLTSSQQYGTVAICMAQLGITMGGGGVDHTVNHYISLSARNLAPIFSSHLKTENDSRLIIHKVFLVLFLKLHCKYYISV